MVGGGGGVARKKTHSFSTNGFSLSYIAFLKHYFKSHHLTSQDRDALCDVNHTHIYTEAQRSINSLTV